MLKINKTLFVLLFISTILQFSACNEKSTEETVIEISAASSLTDVMNEIVLQYTKETGISVQLNYGSSSICARQIKEGKKSSIFISANEMWMDYLNDMYIEGSNRALLNNTLVIVTPISSKLKIQSLSDLGDPSLGKIAMGDSSHVPAGIYGKTILIENDMWHNLKEKIVGAFDARAALALVETDSVACGIIYKTDAMASQRVNVQFEIPMGDLNINYMISRFDANRETLEFYNYLYNDFSRSIFEKYGFTTNDKV